MYTGRPEERLLRRGIRSLFHFAGGRTDGGGLLDLGVNTDQRHSTHCGAPKLVSRIRIKREELTENLITSLAARYEVSTMA